MYIYVYVQHIHAFSSHSHVIKEKTTTITFYPPLKEYFYCYPTLPEENKCLILLQYLKSRLEQKYKSLMFLYIHTYMKTGAYTGFSEGGG